MKSKIKKQFIDFLKKEGVINQYRNNWDFKLNKPIKNPGLYVRHAFDWEESTEGSFLWKKIHNEWQDHIDKIENPHLFHSRCYDCGQFIKKYLWIRKGLKNKTHAHCEECLSCYD